MAPVLTRPANASSGGQEQSGGIVCFTNSGYITGVYFNNEGFM